MKYLLTLEDQQRLETSFTYHKPFGDQPERYEMLRSKAKELAQLMMECCPRGRELSLALTSLEDSIMRANRSIACGEKE